MDTFVIQALFCLTEATSQPASAAVAAAAATRDVQVSAIAGEGVTVASADERYKLNLRARVQLRESVAIAASGTVQNELALKTLRLLLSGSVLDPRIGYFIQLAFAPGDFEKDNPSPVFDAFIESRHLRDLHVRLGQFFVPFDRARTMREFALQFVDRPLVVRELSLDRDVGLMFYSNDLFATRVLGYVFFVGAGAGKNRIGFTEGAGPLVVARLIVRPWGMFQDDREGDLTRDPSPRLALGIAGAYSRRARRQQSTLGPALVAPTDYAHVAADVLFKLSGFSLLAELLMRRASVDTTLLVDDPAAVHSRSGLGYFAQAGYMVHSLVEVVARWEQLSAARQVGGGANVYLNGHAFKIQADYFYALASRDHLARLQVDASF